MLVHFFLSLGIPQVACLLVVSQLNAGPFFTSCVMARSKPNKGRMVTSPPPQHLPAVGIAEQRKAVVAGLHDSVLAFAAGGEASHGEVPPPVAPTPKPQQAPGRSIVVLNPALKMRPANFQQLFGLIFFPFPPAELFGHANL